MSVADHDAVLRNGLRAIENAYVERGRALEAELGALRAWGQEQQDLAAAATRRVRELEGDASAADARAQDAHREKLAVEQRLHDLQREVAVLRSTDQRNHEIERENASILSTMRELESDKAQLELTVRALQKDLTKLDSFKQSIITSIRQEGPFAHDAGLPAPLSPPRRREQPPYGSTSHARSPLPSSTRPHQAGSSVYAPSLAGAGASYRGSAMSQPTAAASGYGRSTPTSPMSGLGAGAGSAAYVDGKDFFRLARSRLSYEQFNQFLANIKSLNDHTQSRDATLERARQIFGPGNEDLFISFRALLAHHGLV